jgi:hypothetical protein
VPAPHTRETVMAAAADAIAAITSVWTDNPCLGGAGAVALTGGRTWVGCGSSVCCLGEATDFEASGRVQARRKAG